MKWKRNLIAIAIALSAVIGLLCFWLFRQYNMQHARMRQQLDDAIAECDYEELLIRGQRLYHKQMTAEYAIGDQDKHQELLWKAIRIERKGNVVKKTTIEKYKVVKSDSAKNGKKKILSLDTARSHPFASIIKEMRRGLHQVVDTAVLPDVATFYNLLDGEEGLRAFFADKPDVLIADVMMPRMDGFEMVRRIREHDKLTPVLFLTARSSVNDVVNGFKMGGDDYLKKPFSLQELLARVSRLAERQQLYRQSSSSEPEESDRWIDIGSYRFNPVTQQLAWQEHVEELSHREAELLRMLAEHANDVVESRAILLALWGDDTLFNGRSLQVFITKLRHRLEHDPQLRIVNVRGIGYKLIIT